MPAKSGIRGPLPVDGVVRSGAGFLGQSHLFSSGNCQMNQPTFQPEGVPIVHRRVAANGLDLHYRMAGENDPILLLHGFPQHSLMWRRVITKLAAGHRVIAPDLRGTGGTTITPAGYDKRTMAADMEGLLSHLGIHSIDVVG